MAALLATVLLRAGNHRNLPLALILLLLAAANSVFHLASLGLIDAAPMGALHAGLALLIMIESVMAGRVIPAFTMGATPGLKLEQAPRLAPRLKALGWHLQFFINFNEVARRFFTPCKKRAEHH